MAKVRLKISPSQLDTFGQCERKWAWRILDGEREPQKPSALYGERVHSVAEAYQLTGKVETLTPHARTFVPGIPFLPLPGTAQVETKFTFTTEAATYTGRIDLHFVDTDGVPTILDHKTTSDFKWMKTVEQLRGKDPQSIVYGVWGLLHYKAEIIRLRWVYYLTGQKPAARKVETVVHANELEEPFAEIERTSKKMLGYYEAGLKALDLPPNPNACGAYGGCAFASKCNLTTAEVMRGIVMQGQLASRLQATRNQQQLPPAHEQAVQQAQQQIATAAATRIAAINPPPATPTAPVAAPAGGLAGRLAGVRSTVPAQPAQPQLPHMQPQQIQVQAEVQQQQITQPAPLATPPVAAPQVAPQAPVAVTSPSVAAAGPAPSMKEATLRDMLASSIVNGLVTARLFDLSAPQTPQRIAYAAYELADAMLQARG